MKSIDIFIGIDTGIDGCIYAIDREGKTFLWKDMPIDIEGQVSEIEIARTINSFNKNNTLIAYEKCQFSKKDTKNKMAFYFGQNYRAVVSVLKLSGYSFVGIPPVTWKKEFNLIRKGKSFSILTAKQLRKENNDIFKIRTKLGILKDKDGRAEAFLIAEYARRRFFGLLSNKKNGVSLTIKKEKCEIRL